MIKKLALRLSAVLLATSTWGIATAADWRKISEDPPIFYDAAHLQARSGKVTVWKKDVLLPHIVKKMQIDLRNIGQEVDLEEYSYSISQWRLDCVGRLHTVLSSTQYKSNGHIITGGTVPKEFQSEEAVMPDTYAELFLDKVCGSISSKSRR